MDSINGAEEEAEPQARRQTLSASMGQVGSWRQADSGVNRARPTISVPYLGIPVNCLVDRDAPLNLTCSQGDFTEHVAVACILICGVCDNFAL